MTLDIRARDNDSRIVFTLVALCLSFGSLLALSACSPAQQSPAQPMLIPLVDSGPFGYAEQAIDRTHIRIEYRGPHYTTKLPPDAPERKNLEKSANVEAYGFANWRAAQLCIKKRFPGYRILSQRPSITIAPISSMPSLPIPDDRIGMMDSTQRTPGLGTPAGISGGDRFQVTYTIVIELQDELLPGDIDAQKMITKMKLAYPGAGG